MKSAEGSSAQTNQQPDPAVSANGGRITAAQREELVQLLRKGEDLSPEWARVLFPPEKREYELVYHGKEREEDILADTLAVPLQPVRVFGKGDASWRNRLIFGDNLQVMKTLLDDKNAGRLCSADGMPGIRLVYIDPPFATRQDFRGTEDQKAYQDRLAGADFLEFLRKRLVLIRELLADDGYVFVHLDQKRCHYIKVLMDEVMGENNFLNHVIWSYRRWPSNSRNYQPMHDDVLVYAKSAKSQTRTFKVEYEEPSESYLKRFQGKTQVLDESGTRKITVDAPTKGMPLRDVWDLSIIAGFKGERTGYPTQKPESLVARIMQTCSKEGDLILDAFAGSGTACAVAEKLRRRWIAIDCGKFAVYTIQKRMLNLLTGIGHAGKPLEARPFALYNAGLYDFSSLKQLPWADWRFFALGLFGCRDEPHKIGGLQFDGHRQGHSVLVFNHMEAKHKGACITEETVQEIHDAVGSRVGTKAFIIAPALAFDFQQDYIDLDGVRYYALRIPYSIIHELHRRAFKALRQPRDEMAVNDTVDAVGFDFIRTPELKYAVGTARPKGQLFEQGFIKIEKFRSDANVRDSEGRGGNLESLSLVMVDFDYKEEAKLFEPDAVYYADALKADHWTLRFDAGEVGSKLMAIFVDIYGNEARVVMDGSVFVKRPRKKKKKAGSR